jgi:hypothetical protein
VVKRKPLPECNDSKLTERFLLLPYCVNLLSRIMRLAKMCA